MKYIIFVFVVLFPVVAHANCSNPITSVPCTMTQQTVYKLANNLTCTGNGACITSGNSNQVLDLNNKTLRCNPSNPTTNATTFGFIASTRNNVSLWGCDPKIQTCTGKITGCFFGAHIPYSTNVLIDRVDFSGNTYIGANTSAGTNIQLTRNTFSDIGGYVGNNNGYAIGINGCGNSCIIKGNYFYNIVTQADKPLGGVGEGVGIIVSAGSVNFLVSNNWFENTNTDTDDIAVWLANESVGIAKENTITGFRRGIIATEENTINNNRFSMRQYYIGSNAVNTPNGTANDNIIYNYNNPILGAATQNNNIIIGE